MKRVVALVSALSLVSCATPAPIHEETQLNAAAAGCGLAPGDLAQDKSERRLLLIVRQDPTPDQRACVAQWARKNHLKTAFLNTHLSPAELNEGCRMIALLAAAGWSITLVKVDPTYLPAINMNGVVHRVEAVTVKGPPELIPTFEQRVESEGWKARLADQSCVQVDPAGHSLDEVTALSFRVNNGEFGDLKLNFVLRPLEKTKP